MTRYGTFRKPLITLYMLVGCGCLSLVTPSPDLLAKTPKGKAAPLSSAPAQTTAVQPEHVILFVLEGIGQDALKGMPTLSRFVKEGSVTWNANTVTPPQRLPAMASLFTGMPVDKHGISWNTFDFIRGYPRPPTLFDYLDLGGGRDSAIFFMDESLYQLAKPEPYTDYQMCGPLKPECSPATIVRYVSEYFTKATSGHGYGHAIPSLPHLLIVHLPEAGRVGETRGWTSAPYRDAAKAVDQAMGSIVEIYRELGLLDKTVVMVTGLSGYGASMTTANGQTDAKPLQVPWIASGPGIKRGHAIGSPVSIIDTGATVMRTLGLTTHTEWESRPVEEIFLYPFQAHGNQVALPSLQ
jgi:hypothetical protein